MSPRRSTPIALAVALAAACGGEDGGLEIPPGGGVELPFHLEIAGEPATCADAAIDRVQLSGKTPLGDFFLTEADCEDGRGVVTDSAPGDYALFVVTLDGRVRVTDERLPGSVRIVVGEMPVADELALEVPSADVPLVLSWTQGEGGTCGEVAGTELRLVTTPLDGDGGVITGPPFPLATLDCGAATTAQTDPVRVGHYSVEATVYDLTGEEPVAVDSLELPSVEVVRGEPIDLGDLF
jgi:hypothetical protein